MAARSVRKFWHPPSKITKGHWNRRGSIGHV